MMYRIKVPPENTKSSDLETYHEGLGSLPTTITPDLTDSTGKNNVEWVADNEGAEDCHRAQMPGKVICGFLKDLCRLQAYLSQTA